MRRRQQLAGFTLWETLLVLSLSLIYLSLPVLYVREWHTKVAVEQFLATFEKELVATQQGAIVAQQATQIYTSAQQLTFVRYQKESVVVIPKELTLTGPEKITFKPATGNNGRLAKYHFFWEAKQQSIDFQFQLGSGRYEKKVY